MVEHLTDLMQRPWTALAQEMSTANPRPLSRKPSDQNPQLQPPAAKDAPDRMFLSPLRATNTLAKRASLENSYDTDGALGSRSHTARRLHTSSNYEHLVSPRLPVRRVLRQDAKPVAGSPLQPRASHRAHLHPYDNHEERDDEPSHHEDLHRRHIRLSRRIQPPTIRLTRALATTPSNGPLPPSPPFRLIFMRHGERANQALGPDWFQKAFFTNTYKPFDRNLPTVLPRRRFEQHYEFDVPLTVRGLKSARLTGRAMMGHHYLADVCLSSSALRCIETCERILTGMDRRDRIPIRIEPGLFECPHANQRLVDSFMTIKELTDNRYNIKAEYKPLIARVNVPESLEEYFERSAAVMQGIINRYGRYGGTVLIVTHAPGLLALTDAIKGTRPNSETFYRQVATYPPLGMFLAEFDGSKWKFSEQPFNLIPT